MRSFRSLVLGAASVALLGFAGCGSEEASAPPPPPDPEAAAAAAASAAKNEAAPPPKASKSNSLKQTGSSGVRDPAMGPQG